MSEKQKGKLTVLVTQCIVCAVILLLGVLIRVLGGGWEAQAKAGLFSALADNTFADALFDPPAAPSETTATTTTTTPASTTAPPTKPTAASPVSEEIGNTKLVAAMASAYTAQKEEQRATEFPSPVCLPLKTGVLTSAFGEREHPVRGGLSVHTGWDIAADKGTPIAAMYDATVEETGAGGSYGKYVQLRVSDRLSVVYAHCSRLLVKHGDTVKAGQTVALVGSTGVSTGNHLHVEFLQQETPLDPAQFLPLSTYAG